MFSLFVMQLILHVVDSVTYGRERFTKVIDVIINGAIKAYLIATVFCQTRLSFSQRKNRDYYQAV